MQKPPLTEIFIDANSDREIRDLASQFGVPASELRIAIYAVGTRVTDLRTCRRPAFIIERGRAQ